MVKYGLRREYLEDMAATDGLQLRDGVPEFLHALKERGVPIHIFSAGLYDIIHVFLRQRGLDGLGHVVSNMMQFDEEDDRKPPGLDLPPEGLHGSRTDPQFGCHFEAIFFFFRVQRCGGKFLTWCIVFAVVESICP